MKKKKTAKKAVKKAAKKKTVKKKAKAPAAKPVNAINWFEIPVMDYNRAASFYSTILGTKLDFMEFGGTKMGMIQGKNGGVGGAIVQGDNCVPTDKGTLVYLNGGNDLSKVLSRVEGAGGRVVLPKTMITKEYGYMAIFIDTEGNKIGLHSMK
jgi:hypothetical protein